MGFVVYTRRGCHLCEVMIESLVEEIGRSSADRPAVELRDIDTDPAWREALNTRIPVLEYDGEWLCDYELDRARVRTILQQKDGSGSAA